MKAGWDLDKLIHSKVMGHFDRLKEASSFAEFETVRRESVPAYSSSIEDAWEVVSKLTKDQWNFEIGFSEADGECRVKFHGQGIGELGYHEEVGGLKFLPHAICLAALKAMGVEA